MINPGCAVKDYFGVAVALWRTTAVIGASGVGQNAGRVYVLPLP